MTRVGVVFRRELRGFLDHPTAYLLAVAFLGLGFFLSFRELYGSGLATLRPFFAILPWLFALFVPAMTMRSLAEERRSKTLEWLMAQPLDEARLVLAKFLGNWVVLLLVLVATLPMAVAMLVVSDADLGIVVAQYVGAALLAALFVAIGLWASSATRNQITAFIVGSLLCVALIFMGTGYAQVGLPGILARAAARLSVITHFSNVARGVIDLRDVVYFASGTAFFLVLATATVSRLRLSPERANLRRLRAGTFLVALVVLLVNLLGDYVRGRLDLTSENLYTLSDGTKDLLGELDDVVNLKLFASSQLPPEVQVTLRDVQDLVRDFGEESNGNVRVAEADPDQDEDAASEASSFGITPIEFSVMRNDEFEVRRGWFGLALQYADQQEVIPVIDRTQDLEFRLATAVSTMTADRTPTVGWLGGFGTRQQQEFRALTQAVSERFSIQPVSLALDSTGAVGEGLDGIDVLLVAQPTEPMESPVVERMATFLDDGGSALMLLEPATLAQQALTTVPVTTGLEGLIEARGARITGELAYDLRSSERISMGQQGMFNVVRPYPYWPIALPAADHATVRNLASLTLGWPGGLEVVDSATVTPLWATTEFGGTVPAGSSIAPDTPLTPTEDDLAPRVLAVAIQPDSGATSGGRMIVVADANFIDDQFAGANPGNLAFAANAIDWLAQDESLIAIRSKDRTPPPLIFESEGTRNFVKWGNLIGVPLLVALFGFMRVTGRRRRAEDKWGPLHTPDEQEVTS